MDRSAINPGGYFDYLFQSCVACDKTPRTKFETIPFSVTVAVFIFRCTYLSGRTSSTVATFRYKEAEQ